MQKESAKLAAANIQVVGVSYDDVKILKGFAAQKRIKFPLLSDKGSKVITAYGVLNKGIKGSNAGLPHPTTIIIGVDGNIIAKLPGTTRDRHTVDALLEAVKNAK